MENLKVNTENDGGITPAAVRLILIKLEIQQKKDADRRRITIINYSLVPGWILIILMKKTSRIGRESGKDLSRHPREVINYNSYNQNRFISVKCHGYKSGNRDFLVGRRKVRYDSLTVVYHVSYIIRIYQNYSFWARIPAMFINSQQQCRFVKRKQLSMGEFRGPSVRRGNSLSPF